MLRQPVFAFLVATCIGLSAWAQEPPKDENGGTADPPKAADPPPAPAPPPVDLARVVEGYIANLESTDPVLATEAYDALREIGSPAVAPLLSTVQAKDTSADAKYMICDLLGELRDRAAVPVLIPILKDPQEHVSSVASAAARALGLLADPSAIEPLREALASTDIELQYEAIRALGNLRAVTTAPDIRKFLASENKPTAYDRYLSCAAIEALGKMKDKASVKEIAKWIRSAEKERGTERTFSHYAIRALESITDQNLGSLTTSDEDRAKTEDAWSKWWDENKAKPEYGGAEEPKAPDPPKDGAEPPKDAPNDPEPAKDPQK